MKSTMARHMRPQYLKATRALGYGLTMADYAGWSAASTLFAVHLKPSEAAALAVAALGALEDSAWREVMDHVQGGE